MATARYSTGPKKRGYAVVTVYDLARCGMDARGDTVDFRALFLARTIEREDKNGCPCVAELGRRQAGDSSVFRQCARSPAINRSRSMAFA